ncbi:MAG: hypothetical protein J6W88_01720 [Bacteroidales bacterium]|nr:hypothetical protein [Bacteroidales bacterium]
MKKIFAMAAVALLACGGLTAQNTFKGIVKYSVESTGAVAIDLPAEVRVAEIKVSGNKMYTKSYIFTQGLECFVNDMKQTTCVDYSGLIAYVTGNGCEFENYTGNGKMLMVQEYKASDFDSLEIVDREPGHGYFEYVAGETKQIAGMTAKKLVSHSFDDEGKESTMEMWYTDEVGPKVNVLFGGIKGMPIEVTMKVGEDQAITYTATEFVSGKVKDTDFILPDGYSKLSDEEMEAFRTDLKEAREMGCLPSGGDDEEE